jgi:hypothetical protein
MSKSKKIDVLEAVIKGKSADIVKTIKASLAECAVKRTEKIIEKKSKNILKK